MRYADVIENGKACYSTYVPVEGLKECDEPIPGPTSSVEFIEVAA